MKKTMKRSTIKIVGVKCSDFWEDEFEVDSSIHDDVYLEAATRAVEKRKSVPGFKVTAAIECWEKKDINNPYKHWCYNTYFVLLNAEMFEKAEMLRENFLKINHIDLQKESLKPKESDGGKPATTTN